MALALTLAIGGTAASACDLPAPRGAFLDAIFAVRDSLNDKPVAQYEDCSFVNGGQHDHRVGQPAQDYGNGQVIQILDRGQESIAITDCHTGDAVILRGKSMGMSNCFFEVFDRSALYEAGFGFGVQAGESISTIVERAANNDNGVVVGLEGMNEGLSPANQVDFSCACAKFYPELPGYTQ